MISEKRYGTIAAVVVAVIWGLSFVAARAVLVTLTPVLLAMVRFVIASLIFLPIVVGDRIKGTQIKSRDLKELAMLGVLSISVYFWLQYTGVKYAGAGISALLVVGLIPILTGIASSVLLKEEISAQKAMGTVLGLIGVALITVPNLILGEVDLMFYLGVTSLLLNSVCWAMYSTLSRRLMKRIKRPALVTAYVTIMGTLALIPMSLTSNWGLIGHLQPKQWLCIFFLAIVCSGLGYFMWNFALSRLEAVNAAVWLYLEPVAAFIGEALFFGILPCILTMLGGFMIIIGAIVTSRSKKES